MCLCETECQHEGIELNGSDGVSVRMPERMAEWAMHEIQVLGVLWRMRHTLYFRFGINVIGNHGTQTQARACLSLETFHILTLALTRCCCYYCWNNYTTQLLDFTISLHVQLVIITLLYYTTTHLDPSLRHPHVQGQTNRLARKDQSRPEQSKTIETWNSWYTGKAWTGDNNKRRGLDFASLFFHRTRL